GGFKHPGLFDFSQSPVEQSAVTGFFMKFPVPAGNIESIENNLFLKTYNSYSKIQYKISNIKKTDNIQVLINSKILNSLISKINSTLINLTQEQNNLLIEVENSKFTLNGIDKNEFSLFNLEVNDSWNQTDITLNDLLLIAKYVISYSVEENGENTKLVNVNCINILNSNNSLQAFATDLKRLAILKLKNNKKNLNKVNFLIYSKTFNQLLKCLNNNENIKIFNSDNNLLIQTDSYLLQINLINLNFPNLTNIAIDQNKNICEINNEELIQKLERGSVLSSNLNSALAYFSFKNNEIILSFKNSEQGYACEILKFNHISGQMPNFSINVGYLINALKNISNPRVKFSIQDNLSPLFIYDLNNENLLQVILPTKNIF
ncbi:MAG: DNA polymerase III subunit beta, partial [Mycoplasmataceae bacterium]|nr:DNA polymerase III subunit beta [Mycoplasmataceae bacterium]